jgi:uncharacterized protein YaaQ
MMLLPIFASLSTAAWSQSDGEGGQGRAAKPPGFEKAPAVATVPLPDTASASDWRASKLIGTTMTNILDESIGQVEDVVIDSDGKVVAVLVSVGGFLGLGETTVAIGLPHLVIARADLDVLQVKTSLTREAIEQAVALDAETPSPVAP